MRGNKLSVDRLKKESQRSAQFGKGGATKMFRQQAAGTDKPGNTVKDQTVAPGAKAARGGPKVRSFSSSVPAKAGITGSR
jgi:hypothetical protein